MAATTPKLRNRARIALAGPLLFAAGTVAMHWLRDDLDPARRAVSEYATGDWGVVQSLAFVALAAGGFALAACVRAVPGARTPASLLAGFGFGMVAVTLFPADPHTRGDGSTVGAIHGAAAFFAFVALLAAMATLARPLLRDGRFGRLPGFTEAMSVLGAALFVVQLAAPDESAGAWQRLFLATLTVWLVVAGWTYARLFRGGGGRGSGDAARAGGR